MPVVVVEGERPGQERVKGDRVTVRARHHELAGIDRFWPAVVEQRIVAHPLALFDLYAVELHALVA